MASEAVEISRGRQASSLLENELLLEALAAIEMKYENGWRNSAPNAVDLREKAYLMLHVTKEFRMYLTNILNTGKMATVQQETRIESEANEIRLKEWDGSPDGRA